MRRVLVALLAAASVFASADLNLGDSAPLLKPRKWLKGGSLAKFEKGHVYVVEFWATWCGPCKEAIPHLTELAKRYRGKVDFVGVSVWEGDEPTDPALPKVEGFVKAKGAAMDYRVAIDTVDNRVADAWLKAAGEGGIPTAFIVGKDGRIASIVHSPDDLGRLIPKVLDESLDIAGLRAERDRATGPMRAIQKALGEKDYRGAIKVIDELSAKNPEAGEAYGVYRTIALSHLESAEFQKAARALLERRARSMDAYNMLCAVIANEKGVSKETLRFGVTLAEEGATLGQREALFWSIASELSEALGDAAGARRYAEATVRAAEGDSNCSESFRSRSRARLEKLRKG